jgi:ferredoxin
LTLGVSGAIVLRHVERHEKKSTLTVKAALRYFSGTGNSYRIAEQCAVRLRARGYEVELASITEARTVPLELDLVGFCFPVYAFALPRIVRKYLRALPAAGVATRAFLLVTAGLEDEAGYSVVEGVRLLNGRRYDVVHADAIEMPVNWTVAMNPPARGEALSIIERGIAKADAVVEAVLAGRRFQRAFNYPSHRSKAGFCWGYYSFRYLGVANLWRNFRSHDDCNGCGTCMAVCPTGSIAMKDRRPVWSKRCEQCMRCVNMCGQKAIWQKGYGSTKERNSYMEPSFRRKLAAELTPGARIER